MASASERAKLCRAHAEQCRADAELDISEEARNDFLKLARQWDQLARQIEAIEEMRVFLASAGRT
jgi:hypothetical protein